MFFKKSEMLILSEDDVQCHHRAKSEAESNRADGEGGFSMGFGDDLFCYNENHRSRREREQKREDRLNETGKEKGKDRTARLYRSGEGTLKKTLILFDTLSMKRHGDHGAFGKILNGDPERKKHCRGEGDVAFSP